MPTPIERARFSRRVRGTPWLLAAALLFATRLWAQEPGTWVPMADLNQARGGHTATLLANGSVLIAGGKDVAGQPLASAEIYDPATGRYALLTSPLPTPVWGHTATRLNDGTILIAGGNGNDGQPVAAAQLFDPAAGTFIRVGSMSTPRSQHTSTLLGDGRVLLAGGTDGVSAVAQLELYDPDARAVSGAPSSLSTARQNHTATRLPQGVVLIAGGSNSSGTLGTAELYDPSSGTVAAAGGLSVGRALASAALLLDGTVLVAGGQSAANRDLDSAEVYDPIRKTFTLVPAQMSTARSGHLGVQLLYNGRVLIAGGPNGGQPVATAEVYDPVTGAFGAVESPTTARQLFAANFFDVPHTGTVLATGGFGGAQTALASSEAFFYSTLRSDKPDYSPGDTVTVTGEGWRPNETITINIHQSSGDPDTTLIAIADDRGAFTNSEFQVNMFDGGVSFLATATGQGSGWTAQTAFTDHPGNTPHSTATGVVCSAANVLVNSTVTCTATVTDTSSAPGNRVNPPGTVSFTSSKAGTFAPATCALVPVASSRDQSSCSVTFTPTEPGTHTITANYSGGILVGHGPGGQNVPINPSSGTFTLTVTARTTSTTLDCPDSTSANSPLLCTVTVTDTASGTKSAPAGTVGFTISGAAGSTVTPNPCTLAPITGSTSSSSCTVSFSANQTGSYTITATYSPVAGTVHSGSSGTDTVEVSTRTTMTTLDCPDSTSPNTPLTCTVTVADTAGGTKSAPMGTVAFSISGGPAGSSSSVTPCALAPSSAGSSSCTVSFSANQSGSYTITATYSPGPGSVHSGSSGTDTVAVITRTTSTTLDCPASTPANSPLTCTVPVEHPSFPTRRPSDLTVAFSISGGPPGSTSSVTPCALAPTTTSSSSCTVMFTANKPGNYTITATYSPAADSIHAGSSGTDTVMVTKRSTMTTVDCTPPTVPAGVSTTCTATVTDNETGTPITPSGTVTFASSGSGTFSPAASCTLTGTGPTATCSVTYTPAPVGGNETQTITATYGGDETHLGSSGATNIVVLALPGKVTGAGQVDLDGGGRASFGFVVQRQTIGGLATGELEYHNHANRVNVHSLGMLTLLIVDNTATFTGTCRNNNTTPCTFTVTVQDNSEPGSRGPNKDKFSITVVATPAEMVT